MRGLGKVFLVVLLMACGWAMMFMTTQIVSAQDSTFTPTPLPTETAISTTGNLTSTATAPAPRPTSTSRPSPTPTPTPVYLGRITAIGDSVMLGAVRELRKSIVAIDVDAGKSRQMREAIRILNARQSAQTLGDIVIVHVGNNGPIDAKMFDALMQPLQNAKLVVVVNLKVPRRWEVGNNTILADGVKRYANTVLMDWNTTIASQINLLAADGTHMGGRSARLYSNMVIDLLSQQPVAVALAATPWAMRSPLPTPTLTPTLSQRERETDLTATPESSPTSPPPL